MTLKEFFQKITQGKGVRIRALHRHFRHKIIVYDTVERDTLTFYGYDESSSEILFNSSNRSRVVRVHWRPSMKYHLMNATVSKVSLSTRHKLIGSNSTFFVHVNRGR